MKRLLIVAATLPLAACVATAERPYGNDALPSAEAAAFQRLDAQLGWRNAEIARDASNCAVYRGTAPDGRVQDRPLSDPAGNRICSSTRPYGNDALPSVEVTAFQQTDARLGWRNAAIARAANGCAVYRGTAPDGQVRDEPLRDSSGQPICRNR